MSISSYTKKYNVNRNFVLFTIVVIGICFLYTDKFYNPKKITLQSKEVIVESIKKEIVSISKASGNFEEKEANLKRLKNEFNRLKREQDALFARFPNKAEASKMLEEVIHEKKFAKISFESFYPSVEIPTGKGYYYIPIEVRIAGSFGKIGEYVKYIENLPRIILVDDIDFSTAPEEDVLSSCNAKLKGKTYVLNY